MHCVLDDALVETTDDVLDHAKLLEQFSACVQDLVRKNVLFAIYP
jgi:hypothetical protein